MSDHIYHIQSAVHPYTLLLSHQAFDAIDWSAYKAVIADARVHQQLSSAGSAVLYPATLKLPPVRIIQASEAIKSLPTLEALWTFFVEQNLSRKDKILVIGGGILHDVGALAAAFYKRGIAWDFAPTTLLSMVDACIGGKCAVNVGAVKNVIGTVYPPQAVYVDPRFAETLPPSTLLSGLAEAAKAAFIAGPEACQAYYAAHQDLMASMPVGNPMTYDAKSTEALTRIIKISLELKKDLIEQDEFDLSVRQYLNFGHTFGHAFESASDHAIDHGIAVALGMVCAIDFAALQGSCITAETGLFKTHLNAHILGHEAIRPHLARILPTLTWDAFWAAFALDKKHDHDHMTLILPATGAAAYGVELCMVATAEAKENVKRCFEGMRKFV
jgi:3-dehydroquinate synthase